MLEGVINLFSFAKKKHAVAVTTRLSSPVNGQIIKLAQVTDPVFAGEKMGPGLGIEPSDGQISAPVAGKISMIAETKHAIGIKTADGLDVLLHLGIDTVDLQGTPFNVLVKLGQKIKEKQRLVEMDLAAIKQQHLKTTVILVITNAVDHKIGVEVTDRQTVAAGELAAEIKQDKE